MEITAKQLQEVSGMSLRKAYYVLSGDSRMSPEEAVRAEVATGRHRLSWLYPDQYDESGHPLPTPSPPHQPQREGDA